MLTLLLTWTLALASPPSTPASEGKVLLTREEALKLAFPDCEIERKTIYLDEAQQKRIAELAKVEAEARIVYAYVATREGKQVGTAYFDTHRVRTLREELMVSVLPDGRIQRLELLSFAEPPEYIPRPVFYAQFAKKALDDELDLKRGLRGVAGATLSSRAATNAARRVLATHHVLNEPPEKPGNRDTRGRP